MPSTVLQADGLASDSASARARTQGHALLCALGHVRQSLTLAFLTYEAR